MVVSDLDVFERGDGVVHENGCGTVERDQVGSQGLAADAHEADRQTRRLLAWESGLEKPDHALFFFSDAKQKNIGFSASSLLLGVSVDIELVARNQGNSAPGNEWRTKQRDGCRGHAAARALASESGDGARVGQKEGRLFPNLGEKLVEIVRCGRALPGLDALGGRYVFQQTVVTVVDELAFLAFLDVFDHQAELFADLIVRIAVEIGNAGLYVEHGRYGAERVFSGFLFVLDVGFG